MPFDWDTIKCEWLLDQSVDYDQEEVVEAFNAVERTFEKEWLDKKYSGVRGIAIAIPIIELGKTLNVLETMPNARKLVEKLKREPNDFSKILAEAEVVAHYQKHGLGVELEPAVKVRNEIKHPDMRVNFVGTWIYVEVTQPDISVLQSKLQKIMFSISEVIKELKENRRVEVYLYREPDEEEIKEIVKTSKLLAEKDSQPQEYKIKGLVQIFSNPNGEERLPTFDDAIQEKRPILVLVNVEIMGGRVNKGCTVKIPFTDERAQLILNRESKQLSKEERCMIIIDVSGIPGGLNGWSELIKRRLQPQLNRRIGAVLLVQKAVADSSMRIETKLIEHPNPLHRIPNEFLEISLSLGVH